MTITVIEVQPWQVKQGDILVNKEIRGWTALSDAVETEDDQIKVEVQYPDGGIGHRFWDLDGPSVTFLVERKENA